MDQDTMLRVERHNHVAELQLIRPDVDNRFDEDLIGCLGHALTELGDDGDVRAIVWSSTGRTFSAGGDFDSMLRVNEDLEALMRQVDAGRRLFRAFADLPKPLVVAIHGDVYGVATSLALTADAVVTAPEVRFVDPHVHVGLAAGDGGCVMWPANLALTRAKRHLLWGDPITGQEAYDLGMVTDIVPDSSGVRDRALELAERVATLPPVAVQMTKRALNKALHARIDHVFDSGFYLEAITAQTDDLREAIAALRERRPGEWSGR